MFIYCKQGVLRVQRELCIDQSNAFLLPVCALPVLL